MIEVKSITNSCPISYLSTSDIKEPLTPFHLMIRRGIIDLPDNLCFQHEDEDYVPNLMTEVIMKRKKYLNATLNWFWKRWTGEYLLGLCEAHIHYNKKRSGSGEISVVIVHNDKNPRGIWNLGKVEKTLPGRDGLVKSAVIHVYTNGKRTKLFCWPVQLLYPIKISSRIDSTSSIEAPLQEDPHQSDDSFFSWKDAPTLVHKGSCIKSLRLDVGSISIWLSYWLWIASVIDLLCIITVFFMIILLFSNCLSVDWLLSVNGGGCVCYDCIHVCNNYYWLDNFY